MIQRDNRLIFMLTCLTLLFVGAQISVFYIHYHVSALIDSLVNSSISFAILRPAILLPIVEFLVIQFMAYALFICWIHFISVSIGKLLQLSHNVIYGLGICLWVLGIFAILALNAQYYPNSFFAQGILQHPWIIRIILYASLIILLAMTVLAYINFFYNKQYRLTGLIILILCLLVGACGWHEKYYLFVKRNQRSFPQPNIILIGLDSLRPDFIGFLGQRTIVTPVINQLAQTATIFNVAYTPLARTFPAWMSVLTAKYPKTNHARINIENPTLITQQDNLAKHLKGLGYTTIYGTDEPRFTDINATYGFDQIIGPKSGIVEFILGGLTDFPLTNLLINLPFGRFLFPYNYGNRGADITYQPDSFLNLIRVALAHPQNKPILLSLHLCLAHWPYTWAEKYYTEEIPQYLRYQHAVERLDKQLGDLLQFLTQVGLLQHSMLVMFSDHGIALGLPADRVIDKKNYLGDQKQLNRIQVVKSSGKPEYSLDFQHDYSINTSYGAGTDILSLKQYRILLMFKSYGIAKNAFNAHNVRQVASLLDVAPTLLDLLHLKPLQHIDGESLKPYFSAESLKLKSRTLFIETGDTIADLATDHILVEKIVKHNIQSYLIDGNSGQLFINPLAEQSIIKSKQRAIILDDWMLAHYPPQSKLIILPNEASQDKQLFLKPIVVASYFVLVNLKTSNWTMNLSSAFAKKAPLARLLRQFKNFYGDEDIFLK